MIGVVKLILKLVWNLRTIFILPLDLQYRIIPYQLLRVIAQQIFIIYKPELADCDDFAWLYKAEASKREENGIGLVIGWYRGLHCWNVAITDKGVLQIEPQTGNIFRWNIHYIPILVII